MTGFLNKLRVVTLGSVHDLLDKAIDMDSPSALRQYTRDLEEALDRMRNEAAVQAGQVRTFERQIGDLQHKIDSGKITAAALIKTNESAARLKAQEVVRAQSQLETTKTQLETQKTTSQSIDAALAQLEAKHADMVARVRDLERIDRDTKTKEAASSALSSASSLINGGSDISVDDIETKMRARNDVASEKFDRAVGSVKVDEDPETASKVDDLLNSLKSEEPANK